MWNAFARWRHGANVTLPHLFSTILTEVWTIFITARRRAGSFIKLAASNVKNNARPKLICTSKSTKICPTSFAFNILPVGVISYYYLIHDRNWFFRINLLSRLLFFFKYKTYCSFLILLKSRNVSSVSFLREFLFHFFNNTRPKLFLTSRLEQCYFSFNKIVTAIFFIKRAYEQIHV